MADDAELTNGAADSVIEYNTYEDYLDSQITPIDLFYLEVFHDQMSHFTFLSRTRN